MLTYEAALYALGAGMPLYDSDGFAYRIERLQKGSLTWTIQVRCIDNGDWREWTREHGIPLSWLRV
jgi:hypothetical protein